MISKPHTIIDSDDMKSRSQGPILFHVNCWKRKKQKAETGCDWLRIFAYVIQPPSLHVRLNFSEAYLELNGATVLAQRRQLQLPLIGSSLVRSST
jgi:hypothetical protein